MHTNLRQSRQRGRIETNGVTKLFGQSAREREPSDGDAGGWQELVNHLLDVRSQCTNRIEIRRRNVSRAQAQHKRTQSIERPFLSSGSQEKLC
jgi:hypothetical protein